MCTPAEFLERTAGCLPLGLKSIRKIVETFVELLYDEIASFEWDNCVINIEIGMLQRKYRLPRGDEGGSREHDALDILMRCVRARGWEVEFIPATHPCQNDHLVLVAKDGFPEKPEPDAPLPTVLINHGAECIPRPCDVRAGVLDHIRTHPRSETTDVIFQRMQQSGKAVARYTLKQLRELVGETSSYCTPCELLAEFFGHGWSVHRTPRGRFEISGSARDVHVPPTRLPQDFILAHPFLFSDW